MKILYHNRKPGEVDIDKKLGAEYVSQDDLFRRSDVLSVHCPLTPETHHLIGQKQFDLMKNGSYFINTARGKIVREEDLVKALLSGKLRGAGLDVFEEEPVVHPELLKMQNVLLLPHIGTLTVQTRQTMFNLCIENITAVLNQQPPKTPVNKIL